MNKTSISFILTIFFIFPDFADVSGISFHSKKGRHYHTRSSHTVKSDNKTDSLYQSRIQALPFECEMFYNSSVRKYIELYALHSRKGTERILGWGEFYFPIIDKIFESYGVPPEMKYIAIIESSLNPKAVSGGVAGMWQFTKSTGQRFGLTVNGVVDERRSIIESTTAVAKYLKLLHEMYPDWRLVLASYNCGSGCVAQAVRKANGTHDFWKIYPFLPPVTRNFIPAFMGIAYTFHYYSDYGLSPVPCNCPAALDTVHLSRPLHLQQVASILNIDINTLKDLNSQYLKGYIPAGKNKTYALGIPAGRKADFVALRDSVFAWNVAAISTEPEVKASATNNAPVNENKIVHRVRTGESLSVIAQKNKVTVTGLKKWNHLKGDKIKPGQRLVIYR